MSDYSALRQSVERFCEKPDGLFEFISVISCINSLPKGALTGLNCPTLKSCRNPVRTIMRSASGSNFWNIRLIDWTDPVGRSRAESDAIIPDSADDSDCHMAEDENIIQSYI